MLLTVESDIRGGMCHAINPYAKANNRYIKDYGKNKELSFLKYWGVNNLCGWTVSQMFLVNGFNRVENTSQIN